MLSTVMFALGTTLSAFWIMANNGWMQVPVGYVMKSGVATPILSVLAHETRKGQ